MNFNRNYLANEREIASPDWPLRPASAKHCSSVSSKTGFSSAAATRSLSFSCLFTDHLLVRDGVKNDNVTHPQFHSDVILA